MLARTFRIALATSVALPLAAIPAPAVAQLVNSTHLDSAFDSAGNPGQITISNPDAVTANIGVLAPVVIANWNQFNVPDGTTLNVSNQSAAAKASLLNRVIGGNFSDMGGTVNAADVNFWLVNQNGILFGNNTTVTANSFIASTLNITDADFFDFYEGTNLGGNGSTNLHFTTNPNATTYISSIAGAKFITDGSLIFLSPGLSLDADFDAGTGAASFIAATDVTVGINPGSPLAYTIPSGTQVASQSVSGSVSGASADFVFITAAGAMNALLTVDADVATTATAGTSGIRLIAQGAVAPDVDVNGALSTTGTLTANVGGDLTIAQPASASAMTLNVGGTLTADDLTATSGLTILNAYTIDASDVSAAGGIRFQADNSSTATFDSLTSSGGSVQVSGFVPDTVTVNGATSGTSVALIAINGLQTGSVTSTAGIVNLTSLSGSVNSGAVSASGGNATLAARTNVTSVSIASTGGIVVESTAGGSLALGNLNAGTTISLDTSGAVAFGSATAGGAFTVGGSVDPSSITATGNVSAGTVDFDSAGALNAVDITAIAGDIDIDAGSVNAGALSATDDVFVDAAGTVSLASARADSDLSGAGGLFIGNTVAPTILTITGTAQGDSVDIVTSGDAILNAVTSTGGLIDIDVSGGLNAGAISSTGGDTSITATGGIITTSIGSSGAIDVDSTGGGNLSVGNLTAGTGISLDTAGTVTGGTVTVGGTLAVGATTLPGAATFTGNISAGSVDIQASGNLNLAGVASTAGIIDLDSTGGAISAGAVSATGGNALLTAPGAISTTSITSTAAIDVDSTAGGTLDLGNLNAMTTITLDTIGALRFGSVMVGAGLLDIGATAIPSAIATTGTIDAMVLSARTTGSIDFSGANRIMALGTISAGGSVVINSVVGLAVNGLVTATGQDVTLKTTGDITVSGGGRVTGRIVVLSAEDNFINDRGADAVTASDHWVVYSNAPAGNTFGNLDSGNTAIWNATIATLAPSAVSGNRYVFALQPTLTVSSTSVSKIYGTDLTGMLDGYFTVSGFQPGVAGAYLADTAANTLSGSPLITSAGAAERADVAGSPYVMEIELGTLAAARGYVIALSDAGTLTVTPKPVTASVAADDKTYNGSTAGTGSISSAGFLSGDDVTITGTTYTFSDKNAGIDKTVTISGATLSGIDAGNYILTVPTNTLADIIAKAIGATVVADDKIYDGTTSATGSLTLNGGVAGDDLSTSGTTFTFSDKNAGTDKTATIVGTTLTGADAGNYVLTVPATTLADIFARAIGATVSADDKTYDGSIAATGWVALTGVLAGDDLGTSGTTFTFADKNAGTDKTVTVGGTTLTGTDAGNYVVTVPASTLADIFAKAISATVIADDKTYDGTTAATGSVSLVGVVAGDSVNTAGTTFTFSDKNAGADKTVVIAGTTLTGTDAGNYSLTVPASTLADIFAKAITATVVADDKIYDGTTVGLGSVSLVGVVSGDSVATSGTTFTFADKNAGTDKSVTISGTTLTGADAGNYTVNVPTSAMADILAKAITATASANDKTYDGTIVATGSLVLNGIVASDSVGTSGTAFAFADKNAGTDKTVTASGTTLTGTDANNYTLTGTSTALADILAKAITGTVSVNDKVYDGTTAATGTVTLIGVVSGDAVSTTGTTFTFVDPNAGTNKTVRVGGTALAGADSGNYTLTLPSTALADILRRAIEIVAVDGSKSQGQIDPALAYTVGGAGLVAGDSLTGTLQRAPGEIVGTYAIGQGSVTAGENYTITFTGGTFTVRPTPVPNTLRTMQLPSEVERLGGGSGITLRVDDLCPKDDRNCTL